ncbi:MAG: hypothetical protein ACI814_001949 [Mariniblastus sp.]|jgi:hypothetical protein
MRGLTRLRIRVAIAAAYPIFESTGLNAAVGLNSRLVHSKSRSFVR